MFESIATGLATSALYDFSKAVLSAAEKTELVQLARKQLGIAKTPHDFSERYLEALVELRFEGKDKAVLELFRDEHIMQIFYDYHYGPTESRGDEKVHTTALNQSLAFLRKAYPAKPDGLDIKAEVEHFWEVFRQKVRESRTVKEAEINQKLDELKATAATTEQRLQGLQAWLQARAAEWVEWQGRMEAVPKGSVPEVLREAVVQIVGSKNVVAGSTVSAGRDARVGDDIHNHYYGDKKIPRALTQNPFQPEVFIGREKELQAIHDKLFAPKGNLLLLMNGEGGVGKTTLAARYYAQYQSAYEHTAWVLCEPDMTAALLQLATPLGLSFPEQMRSEQRLERLLAAMAGLKRPCLLVVDNANELPDLARHYQQLRRCSNFHLLLTTRITAFERAACYRVQGLPEPKALDLFRRHYPKLQPEEEALVRQIRTAVGGNTLVLELLAKNLAQSNRLRAAYTLAGLLADLQSRGLLAITQTRAVATDYQSRGAMRREQPEDIIRAMYDLSRLGEEEQALLSIFAVLPAERIAFDALEALLPNFPEPDTHLLDLAQSGWLDFNEAAADFKCSPVVQAIAKEKNRARLAEDCAELVGVLTDKLDYEGTHLTGATYAEAERFARYAEAVVAGLRTPSNAVSILCERIGNYHATVGNLSAALAYYEKYAQIAQALCAGEPDNADFKNGLAISYEKLGETHRDLGDLKQALTFFEQYNQLEKELHQAYPENADFKNGLAISYAKLGETHSDLGDLKQALTFFEQVTELFEKLHQAYPENVGFKNGLAISYEKLGQTHSGLGDLKQALTFFEQDNQLEKELHQAYPENVGFKNVLAISYAKLGQTHSDLGDLKQALTFFEQVTELFEELHQAYPENVGFKNGLAISYEKLGETHRDLGDLKQALTFFEQETELFEELHEAYPENVGFKNGLAVSYYNLGQLYEKLGDLPKAFTYYEQDLKFTALTLESSPSNSAFRKNLKISYQKMGAIAEQLGKADLAALYLEQAAAVD